MPYMKFSDWREARQQPKTCVICRGVSGAGKSYETSQVLKEFGVTNREQHVFSTDDYWVQDMLRIKNLLSKMYLPGGNFMDRHIAKKYKQRWSGERLRAAHQWNFDRFRRAVDRGITPVVVDNTNTTAKEMQNYAQYARVAGYEIIIREPSSPWWKENAPLLRDKDANQEKIAEFAKMLAARNQHGVPDESIRKMLMRWQPDIKPEDL